MSHVFFATLGQRPEVITVALDMLMPRYQYAQVVILHTHPKKSGIAQALADLTTIMKREHPADFVRYFELGSDDGKPILDITDEASAHEYMMSVYRALAGYRNWPTKLHLLVAGGRKAMTIFATLAATYVFDEYDRVWTVLSPESLLQPGMYHAPGDLRDQVQLVELPIVLARNAPGVVGHPPSSRRKGRREDFLLRLTPEERTLAELFRDFPYASDEDFAAILFKSDRTIQTQLRSIYRKLNMYFDNSDRVSDKRRLLADLMKPEER